MIEKHIEAFRIWETNRRNNDCDVIDVTTGSWMLNMVGQSKCFFEMSHPCTAAWQ